jgi:predicted ferric reductase
MKHDPHHLRFTAAPIESNEASPAGSGAGRQSACARLPGTIVLQPATRRILTAGLVMVLLLILGLAGWIPFGYESSSLLYQFGLDRTLLRAGKIAGLASAVLLFLQILSASRLTSLDRVLGLNRLYAAHRLGAVLALLLVVAHPFLVLGPNGIFSLKPTMEFWPEWLGVLLLIALGATVVLAMWREKLKLPFHLWWLGHRLVTPVLIVLVGIHTFNVSDTFAGGLPRALLILALALFGLAWLRLKISPTLDRTTAFTVNRVEPVSRDTVSIELSPARGQVPPFVPGQFAFVQFFSSALSREEHPFTIASSPAHDDRLEIIAKKCGDWTDRLDGLNKGDKARIQGPFGLFSICAHPEAESFVFIAGGVGVTPFVSMLRTMAHLEDPRAATLLWSTKTRADVFLAGELEHMASSLKQCRIETVATREPARDGRPQRLDRSGLEQLLPGWGPATHFFICGPRAMMKGVRSHLLGLGIPRMRIHSEEFKL